jgi:hypothetical protein
MQHEQRRRCCSLRSAHGAATQSWGPGGEGGLRACGLREVKATTIVFLIRNELFVYNLVQTLQLRLPIEMPLVRRADP